MEPLDKTSKWLRLALTHRSTSKNNNERLEFFGDALLGFVLADEIFRRYPKANEGMMTMIRAHMCNRHTLAEAAKAYGFDRLLQQNLAKKEQDLTQSTRILSSVLEAFFGAVYMECGEEDARTSILKILAEYWPDPQIIDDNDATAFKSPKSQLQEWLQKRGMPAPTYRIIDKVGADHQANFFIECKISYHQLSATGYASRRQEAENHAADRVLAIIESEKGDAQIN